MVTTMPVIFPMLHIPATRNGKKNKIKANKHKRKQISSSIFFIKYLSINQSYGL